MMQNKAPEQKEESPSGMVFDKGDTLEERESILEKILEKPGRMN